MRRSKLISRNIIKYALPLSIALLLSNSAIDVQAQKKLLLMGGNVSFCSSASSSECAQTNINWSQVAKDQGYPSDVKIKYDGDGKFQSTNYAIDKLSKKSSYPSWALKNLKQLDTSKEYGYSDFKKALTSINPQFLNDISDDDWQATIGYMTVLQTEIISFDYSTEEAKAIAKRFVDMSGGTDAVVGIVSSSSQDDKDSFNFYDSAFTQAGIKEAVWIPVDLALRAARVDNNCLHIDDYVAKIYGEYDTQRRYPELTVLHQDRCLFNIDVEADLQRISGIFFTGGDQSRHKQSFMTKEGGDTEEMKIIRKRVNAGLPVSGTSAGTAVQCGPSQTNKIPMIAGGESYQALVDKALDYVCTTSDCQDDLQYDPQGGLDIFQYGLLDTHFSQRGRQGRAIKLSALLNINFAFGVDETTSLIVEEDKADPTIANFEVFGKYGVSIFDLSNSKYNNSQQSIKQITNVTYHYVTHGDKFTLSNGKLQNFTVASYKNTIKEKGKAQTSTDIFSSPNRKNGRENYMKFVEVATNLMSSSDRQTWGETYETDAQIFRVNFTKTNETTAFAGQNTDFNETRYFIRNLKLDLFPLSSGSSRSNIEQGFLQQE